jgi:hypothetical protein
VSLVLDGSMGTIACGVEHLVSHRVFYGSGMHSVQGTTMVWTVHCCDSSTCTAALLCRACTLQCVLGVTALTASDRTSMEAQVRTQVHNLHDHYPFAYPLPPPQVRRGSPNRVSMLACRTSLLKLIVHMQPALSAALTA